jgi:hypothetical protein
MKRSCPQFLKADAKTPSASRSALVFKACSVVMLKPVRTFVRKRMIMEWRKAVKREQRKIGESGGSLKETERARTIMIQ